MALQVSKTLSSGIVAPAAYAKIVQVSGDKDVMNLTVSTWYSAATHENNQPAMTMDSYHTQTPTSAVNFMNTMYNFLKTLPDFADSIDI